VSRKRKATRYIISTGIKYGHLEVVDVPAIVAGCRRKWFNQTLVKVNDSVVRLGIVKGEFHWHKHEHDDEFFFVLEGQLTIELENRTIELGPGQGVEVPENVMHRPRAPKKTVMLMVETQGIEPEGNRRRHSGTNSRPTEARQAGRKTRNRLPR
jgi:mannose-6-phosphate isomerase-like protein (cupin superfamily)